MDKYRSMYMKRPAIKWQDAVPLGNGRLGALIYGAIKHERMTFNHENLYLPCKKPKLNPVYQNLGKIRELISSEKYKEAEKLLCDSFGGIYEPGYNLPPYQPLCDLYIDFSDLGEYKNYKRTLDFETATASVSFSTKDAEYKREYFVDINSNIFCAYVSNSIKKPMSCRMLLTKKDGCCDSWMLESIEDLTTFSFNLSSDGSGARFEAEYPSGEKFGSVLKLKTDGVVEPLPDGSLNINNFTELYAFVSGYAFEDDMPSLEDLNYDKIKQCHEAVFGSLFKKTELEIESPDDDECNEILLLKARDGDVSPILPLKMFFYGRYLLISSSYNCEKPANLQGLWNGDYKPMWESDFHNDENIQMNYWAALPGGLEETELPFLNYYYNLIDDYRQNARALYNCGGIFVPPYQTTNGLVNRLAVWNAWTAGAGWIAQHFFDYYLFTQDKEFLCSKALPFMEETAAFYADFMTQGKDGKYVFSPSLSPENIPLNSDSLVTFNSTMDIAVAKEVFSNLKKAYADLEIDDGGRWQSLIDALPEYKINSDGAIKEWVTDKLEDNYYHRHLSPLYPLFPGTEITKENNPKLFESMRVCAMMRLSIGLSAQAGWSFVHQANSYARLRDGEQAYNMLEYLLRSCVGENLFTYHNDTIGQGVSLFWGHENMPPFQIDANFGLTAAVYEMLVQSNEGSVILLPALPKCWNKGRFKGVKCRGGISADIEWDIKRGFISAELRAKKDCEISVHFPADCAVINGYKLNLGEKVYIKAE